MIWVAADAVNQLGTMRKLSIRMFCDTENTVCMTTKRLLTR